MDFLKMTDNLIQSTRQGVGVNVTKNFIDAIFFVGEAQKSFSMDT